MNAEVHTYVAGLGKAPSTLEMLSELDGGPESFLESAPPLLKSLVSKIIFHSEQPGNRRYARVAPTQEQER